jgi:DnaK suppressor protein
VKRKKALARKAAAKTSKTALKKKSPPAATRKRLAAGKALATKARRPTRPTAKRAVPAAKPVSKPAVLAKAARRPIKTGEAVSIQKPAPTVPLTPSPGRPRARPAPYQAARDEEYMNANQVTHFRELLLNWRHDLMQEVDRTVHHMQDDAANFPDPNDRATQEEEFALELRTRDRERKLIKKINESLAALDAGTYGYCEMCGVEIGIKRLEARPTATLCIDCKTLDEIREKQRA